MRHLLTSLLIGATASAQAALAPQRHAPLLDHLLEVNAQWCTMDPMPLGGDRVLNFPDDRHRIAMHLQLVRERLIARTPPTLGATARARRLHLLERLGSYAAAMRFPRNEHLPHRNPVFIDAHGTACAVGWLMIESGHRALAEAVRNGMNLGYVHGIVADARFARPVAAWAREHGFSADELAWIQPAYAPEIPTFPLGGGTDGPVNVMLPLPNGNLLVAGAFSLAGTTAAGNVAVWNGSTYNALGAGVEGTVECAAVHNGVIWLGGSFLGVYDAARWQGNSWTYETIFQGMAPATHALHVHNGVLHAAGEASGFAGTDHLVKRLENGGWTQVGSRFNDRVNALTTFAGELVAGGAFTQPMAVIDPLLLRVARFDGTDWAQYANGLNATVHAFLHRDGKLYAGGQLFEGNDPTFGTPTFGLARIAPGGPLWEVLLQGHPAVNPLLATPHIATLANAGAYIIFGGDMMVGGMMDYSTHMGLYEPASGAVWPGIWHDGAVRCIHVDGQRVHYGGDFDLSSEGPLHHAAYTDMLVTGARDLAADDRSLHVWPNPAHYRLNVAWRGDLTARWRLFDLHGRPMEPPAAAVSGQLRIDTGSLAPGLYTLVLEHEGSAVPVRFVKE
jgi:hypothetical protein